ncbi:MAG: hypothetical protein QXS02_01485 [Candidatus Thermoplasmatota archaeon]
MSYVRLTSCLLVSLLLIMSIQPTLARKHTAFNNIIQNERCEGYEGVHLDCLVASEIIGVSMNIWNYGTKPALFVFYEVTTKGLENTTVIGGNKKGVIPVIYPKDTLFIRPLIFPKVKMICPVGRGTVEITIRVYCKNANYDNTIKTYWFIKGLTLSQMS